MDLLNQYSHLPFFILASITVICSLGMILLPNLVRAGFLLIGSFCAIAGLYFVLAANFVAISQILIYAVGIVLVIIFAVMLCSLKERASDSTQCETSDCVEINSRKVLAFLVALGFFITMVYVINAQDWSAIAHISGAEMHTGIIPQLSREYTSRIGQLMLSRYILPFELISVLLLVILVGVIILSKKNLSEGAPQAK